MRSFRRLSVELLEDRDLFAVVQITPLAAQDIGSRGTIPVNIDDATGVRAAEIHVEYDPTVLDIQPEGITAGSIWSRNASAVAKVDAAAGEIAIFVFAAEAIDGAAGSLVDLSFAVRTTNACTAKPITIELAEVRLNEEPGDVRSTRDFDSVAAHEPILALRSQLEGTSSPGSAPFGPAEAYRSAMSPKVLSSGPNGQLLTALADPLFATLDDWLMEQ